MPFLEIHQKIHIFFHTLSLLTKSLLVELTQLCFARLSKANLQNQEQCKLLRLSYTITQTYGRTRPSSILASENNSKQTLINLVHMRQTDATSEAQFVSNFQNRSMNRCSIIRAIFVWKKYATSAEYIHVVPFFCSSF